MTLPLPASYTAGSEFTADNENDVEDAINALGAGTLPIPKYPLASSASTLTLTGAYNMYVFTGSSTATWTLPAVSAAKVPLTLVNRGTAAVTVQRAGSDQIYNMGSTVTSVTLPVGGAAELVSDGSFWLITDKYIQPPSYDGSAKSGYKSNISSGTAWTWTQTVTTNNCYGIVALFADSAGSGDFVPDTATKVVTFGGVTLSYLGWVGDYNNLGRHAAIVFGGSGIPAGLNTISVTFTQSGRKFYGHGMSFTYANVSAVGTLQGGAGEDDVHKLSVTPIDSGATIAWMAMAQAQIGDMADCSISNVRQTTGTSSVPRSAVGDMSVHSTNPAKAWLYEIGYADQPVWGTHVGLSLK